MKAKIISVLSSMLIGLSLFALSDVASARCWVTRGYWAGGYWHAGHRFCDGYRYGYRRCGWVRGYRDRFGYWHRGYRNCF